MKIFRNLFLLLLSLLLAPTVCQGQDSGFDGIDTDSDGKVSKKEFKEYAETRLPDFDQLDKFADRVDADKDGSISEDEFEDRMDVLDELSQEMLKDEDTKKKMSEEDLKMVEEATKAFTATTKLASENDWEKAVKGMTKQASEDYAVGVVTQSLTLIEMQLPPQMDIPVINDAKDATSDVLEEYKLDEIDVSSILRNRRGRANSDDDEDEDEDMTPREKAKARQEKMKAKQDKVKAEVKAAIDKDDQRWEIVTALRKSSKEANFLRDVFAAKVGDSEVKDGVVFLTVTQEALGGSFAVPTVLKMTDVKGDWKYDGVDSARTQKALQQTIRRLRGGAAPKEPDTDF